MFADGIDPRQVAAVLEVSTKSAYTWRRTWAADGEQALASKGPSGPDRVLSDAQVAKLVTKLQEGPAAAGCGRKLSIAGLAAYRTGHRPRLIYRVILHTGRKGEPKSFTETHFAALLDAAHQQLGGPILLIWDQLPQHKSARMRALIAARRWLRVYPLPALAPELNPTETIWSSLKRSMANLAPGSIKDLARITRKRIKSMQYQPDLITGFLTSTELIPP